MGGVCAESGRWAVRMRPERRLKLVYRLEKQKRIEGNDGCIRIGNFVLVTRTHLQSSEKVKRPEMRKPADRLKLIIQTATIIIRQAEPKSRKNHSGSDAMASCTNKWIHPLMDPSNHKSFPCSSDL